MLEKHISETRKQNKFYMDIGQFNVTLCLLNGKPF
jgi:hypothetical protein